MQKKRKNNPGKLKEVSTGGETRVSQSNNSIQPWESRRGDRQSSRKNLYNMNCPPETSSEEAASGVRKHYASHERSMQLALVEQGGTCQKLKEGKSKCFLASTARHLERSPANEETPTTQASTSGRKRPPPSSNGALYSSDEAKVRREDEHA